MPKIYVYIDLRGETLLVGHLWYTEKRGRKHATFEYSPIWLKNPNSFPLQPSMSGAGKHFTRQGQPLLGALSDSAPDSWGRNLLKRYYSKRGDQKTPLEKDFLLAVNDLARIGALRFSLEENGPFLAKEEEMPIRLFSNSIVSLYVIYRIQIPQTRPQ